MEKQQIHIFGEHLQITEGIKEHVFKKASHLKTFESSQKLYVRLHANKNERRANLNTHHHGHDLHAESENSNLYMAMDEAFKKLDKQINKLKEKSGGKIHLEKSAVKIL